MTPSIDRGTSTLVAVLVAIIVLATNVARIAAHVPTAGEKAENVRAAAAQADAVIHGVVTKVEYRMSAKKAEGEEQIPHTFVTYDIREVLRGRIKNKTLTVRFIGGPAGRGRFLTVSGVPLFDLGYEDILFILGNGQSDCPLVNCEYGRFRIYENRVYNAHALPIVEVTPTGHVKAGAKPEVQLLKVSFPAPAFDEVIKRPEVKEQMEKMSPSADRDELRKRYEREAPKSVEYAVRYGETSSGDSNAQVPRDVAAEASKETTQVQQRPAISAQVFLRVLKEQLKQVPARPKRTVARLNPDLPFTVRTPPVAKPGLSPRAEVRALRGHETPGDRKERELLEKQDFDPVIRKEDRQ